MTLCEDLTDSQRLQEKVHGSPGRYRRLDYLSDAQSLDPVQTITAPDACRAANAAFLSD